MMFQWAYYVDSKLSYGPRVAFIHNWGRPGQYDTRNTDCNIMKDIFI